MFICEARSVRIRSGIKRARVEDWTARGGVLYRGKLSTTENRDKRVLKEYKKYLRQWAGLKLQKSIYKVCVRGARLIEPGISALLFVTLNPFTTI